MKKKTQFALGLLLASVVVFSSVSVGLSAWVSIDIKHDNALLQQELCTVRLMDEGGTKALHTYEGLERNSSFDLPVEDDSGYKSFAGWTDKGKTNVYTGTLSLASFATLDNRTLTLYASWKNNTYIKVSYENQTPLETKINLQSPYYFPLFNLHPTFTVAGKKLTSYTYANSGGPSHSISYRKRTASGYEAASSSAATITFSVNDSLILTEGNFSEIDTDTPVITLPAVYE